MKSYGTSKVWGPNVGAQTSRSRLNAHKKRYKSGFGQELKSAKMYYYSPLPQLFDLINHLDPLPLRAMHSDNVHRMSRIIIGSLHLEWPILLHFCCAIFRKISIFKGYIAVFNRLKNEQPTGSIR
uniref:Uncharacterized protein n=1 Tax=Globodera rostochiensis TaxID=31243 RepID=A0A914HRN7_GLORO